jgi:hypothetical protein
VSLLLCRGQAADGVHLEEWPQRAVFVFSVPGCEDKRVEVGLDWQPKVITMSCSRP